jgi:hypothetical protein
MRSSADPALAQRLRPAFAADYCSLCMAAIGVIYRPDGTGWICRTCAAANPQMCESCGQRPAAIVEHGYHLCLSPECRGRRG